MVDDLRELQLGERRVERAPIPEVIRRHPKEIVLSMLARMAEQAPFYIFTAFVFAYGVGTLKLPRDFLLALRVFRRRERFRLCQRRVDPPLQFVIENDSPNASAVRRS